jgi:hypothetical protein
MKRCSFKILLTLLAISAAQVQAIRFTNKTHASFRPQGGHITLENTVLHNLDRSPDKNAWLGTFQGTAFFQRSENGKELGRLFLFGGKDSVKFEYGAAAAPVNPALDLDFGWIIHNNTAAGGGGGGFYGENASMKLAPERSSYGVRVDYDHDLSRMIKGLHFHVSAPIVHIQHHLNKIITGSTADQQKFASNYFSGQHLNTTGAGNDQAYLQNALIGDQRITGVADVDLELNYDITSGKWGMLRVGLGGSLPSGNTPDGKYVFQPICGNGHHFALGAQGALSVELFKHKHHSLEFHSAVRYRYLFEGVETRTLGIVGRNFGQYHLLGKIGSPADTPLIPAANVLTQALDVTPGHQTDLMAGLSYEWRKLTVDAGYNLFSRHQEGVRLRDAFADGVYAVANRDFDTGNVFAGGTALNQADLDLAAVRSEGGLSHSAYLSLGINTMANNTPVMVAVGGSYEFAARNNMLEQWTVWGKAGISF